MRKKHARSFDLLSRFDGYIPSYTGMFMLLLLLGVGTALGMLVMMMLIAADAEMANTYGLLVVYPIQFIPAMIYASSHSYPVTFDDEECVPVDNYRFHAPRVWQIAISVAVGTIACAVVTEPVISLLPEMPENLKEAMKMLTGGPLWVSLLSTAVFAPFFEEWLCRGMILRGLLRKVHPALAIAISAAFFALIHMNFWQAIPAFLLGCLFGLVYYKTGSLKLTMLMHAVNNAFSVMLTHLPGADDCDYIWQMIPSRTEYGIIYAACVVLLFIFILYFTKTGNINWIPNKND